MPRPYEKCERDEQINQAIVEHATGEKTDVDPCCQSETCPCRIGQESTGQPSIRGVAFFVLAFVGSWLCFAPMVLGQNGLGLLPYSVPFWLYVMLFLAAPFSGPTVAALGVTAALEGKTGVKHFLRRYGQWRVGLRWYLLFLVGFPALYLEPASFWLGVAPWQALVQQWATVFTTYLSRVLIFPALISWGKEAGWRGFA